MSRTTLIRLAGFGLVLGSLWYLAAASAEYWADLGAWRPSRPVAIGLLALSIVYAANLFLLAEGWHRILNAFGPVARDKSYLSLTATQLARYIPGNVAHIIGRAAWLRGGALGDGAIGKATLTELIVTPVGAGAAILLLSPFVAGALLSGGLLVSYAAALLGVVALMLGFLRSGLFGAATARRFLWPIGFATAFMLIYAAVFAAVAMMIGIGMPALVMVVGLVAWVAGYFAPGVPGGIGVREAVLVAALAPLSTPEQVLIAAVLLRIVTTLGEVLCFLAGFGFARWTRQTV